jgi:hypothetical protein
MCRACTVGWGICLQQVLLSISLQHDQLAIGTGGSSESFSLLWDTAHLAECCLAVSACTAECACCASEFACCGSSGAVPDLLSLLLTSTLSLLLCCPCTSDHAGARV